MINENNTVISIDANYAPLHYFTEILDCSPLYVAHLVAFSISSVYTKLSRKKDTKLSAVEFFAASLLEESHYLSQDQIRIAEKNGEMILKTQEKIKKVVECSDSVVPINFLSKLESALLGRIPKEKLVINEDHKQILTHIEMIRKVSATAATDSSNEIEWYYYHWIKRLRHLLAEEIVTKLLLEHRPYGSWIKRNGDGVYLVVFSTKKLEERETRRHLRSMEGVLIEAYNRFNRRIVRLCQYVSHVNKAFKKTSSINKTSTELVI